MTLPPWYRILEAVGGPFATPATPIRLLLGLPLLFIAADTANAVLSPACGPGLGNRMDGLPANCYPWGSAGPFDDFWFWRSKAAYLTCNALQIGLCAGGILATFWCRPRWLGIVLACIALVAVILLPIAGATYS